VSSMLSVVLLSDLDAMIREASTSESQARLSKLGFGLEGLARLTAQRGRLVESIGRRWSFAYERARQRYGRAVAAVRDHVCSGCFVTLPVTARPREALADVLNVCESCGRILYWT
jgi:predicted  nucleic acid-binding Zn-ribbon protein